MPKELAYWYITLSYKMKCIYISFQWRLLIFHGCYIKFCIAVQSCILIKFVSYSIYVIRLLYHIFITKTEKVFLSLCILYSLAQWISYKKIYKIKINMKMCKNKKLNNSREMSLRDFKRKKRNASLAIRRCHRTLNISKEETSKCRIGKML